MYADRITGSMQRAMDEVDRRRIKQIAHNKEHGITPTTIRKQVRDIMEGARAGGSRAERLHRVAEKGGKYAHLTPEQAMQKIKQLEKDMLKHARELEFEEAAALRDQISQLQQQALGLSDVKAG